MEVFKTIFRTNHLTSDTILHDYGWSFFNFFCVDRKDEVITMLNKVTKSMLL